MTETRDFDRLARAWLDLMPDEAPDRVIDAVLQAVDVTPQRRTPFDPAIRRFFPMNRLTYAAVALAIVVLGGGALLLTQFHLTNVGPSQGPTATPAPSPTLAAGAPLPQALQARWFGGGRALSGLQAGVGTVLRLDPLTFKVAQANQQDTTLFGGAAASVNGRIKVERGSGPALACGTDIGSYAYDVSASGQTLTISDPLDSCAIRQSTLDGTWWRIDCKVGQTTCLGAMDAGTYGSQYIRPLLGGEVWTPKYGGLTFTVPDGWANDADWPTSFSLSRLADFQRSPTGEGSPRLEVLTQVRAEAQGADRCGNAAAPGVATTASAVISYARGIPGLVVSKSHQLTIDGHLATWVDLSVDAGTVKACAGSGDKIVGFMVTGGEGFAIGIPSVYRMIFVDLGGSDLLAIAVEAPDQTTVASFFQEVLPIIESFHFE